MKKTVSVLLCFTMLTVLLAGCKASGSSTSPTSVETTAETTAETTVETTQTAAEETLPAEEDYIGEYSDTDFDEPTLGIAKAKDGSFRVYWNIIKLTQLSDGVGALESDGLHFTATDAAGNPIGAVITVEDGKAAVTITDSTWEYLKNGESFTYPKTADTTTMIVSADYIGEYTDTDYNEAVLEIGENEDGTYTVQLNIIKLTQLSDGVGTLESDGLYFTATDAAGNPIGAVIVVEDGKATVTITDSTWEYLKNGESFTYTKTSDYPNYFVG